MAGIGFRLDRLSREDGLLGPVASIGHGAAVIAGPWLLAVVALKLINLNLIHSDMVEQAFSLQATLIYLFFISLVAAAPITAFAIRLVSDDLFEDRKADVSAIYLLSLIAAALTGAVLAFCIYAGVFDLKGEALAAAILAAAVISMVWPAAAFCAAMQDYRTVTVAFVLGFGFSVAATIGVVGLGGGIAVQTLAFAFGLGLASLWLSSSILSHFAAPVVSVSRPLKRLLSAMSRYRAIGAGAGFGVLAIWIDSIVVWLSPFGDAALNGLPTSPFYDSAMFISRLTMLPGLVVFLTSVDSDWFVRMQAFLGAMRNHETLDHIEARSAELKHGAEAGIFRLVGAQMIAALVLTVLAPALVEPLALQYQQIALFRVGTLGAAFYVVFFAATTLVLNCGRDRAFLSLQALFLVLNVAATLLFLRFGQDYLGFGFFAASAIAAVIALATLNDTLDRLVFLTFSYALRSARAERRPWTPKPARKTGARLTSITAIFRVRHAGRPEREA
ncbi:exopolysaccharide Pel transporter PelG [Oricola sp.]|uniref:exopolysaccharide Pel transporter PelG n=1 Tax=Oricola sp. TaxID=1979950 RepID=UPI0025ED655D|nr:exopolysaccharide Pel transporter PelG [Oricola sp.]MCI5077073.1 exopolysaccharide Pel transporter PelG [Oricola sp.]